MTKSIIKVFLGWLAVVALLVLLGEWLMSGDFNIKMIIGVTLAATFASMAYGYPLFGVLVKMQCEKEE